MNIFVFQKDLSNSTSWTSQVLSRIPPERIVKNHTYKQIHCLDISSSKSRSSFWSVCEVEYSQVFTKKFILDWLWNCTLPGLIHIQTPGQLKISSTLKKYCSDLCHKIICWSYGQQIPQAGSVLNNSYTSESCQTDYCTCTVYLYWNKKSTVF